MIVRSGEFLQYPYLEIILYELFADAALEKGGLEPFDETEDEGLVAGLHFDVYPVDGDGDAEKVAHHAGGFFVADGAGPLAVFEPRGGGVDGDKLVFICARAGYDRRVKYIIHKCPFVLKINVYFILSE